MSWESPIDVYTITNEMATALDDEIVTVVQRFGFDVNKEELTKALQYDRGQYEKGYADGKNADKWIPVEKELPDKEQDVLITYIPRRATRRFVIIGFYMDGLWFTIDRLQIENVFAWQPLPKAYNPVTQL